MYLVLLLLFSYYILYLTPKNIYLKYYLQHVTYVCARLIYNLLTTSHTHLLLTTPTIHTHRFHPLSKIVIHTSAHPYCTEVWMTILECGWKLWVWLMGVVSRRWVWLVVRRYIDILTMIINFPYSTCSGGFRGGSMGAVAPPFSG